MAETRSQAPIKEMVAREATAVVRETVAEMWFRSRSRYADPERLETVDFPRFHGDKILDWLFQIEQFFLIERTPEELKVGIASIHFDDIAATLHQSIVQSMWWKHVRHDWCSYKLLLQVRYNKHVDDSIAKLKLLKETEGIEVYHARFESISTRVKLDEDYLVSLYLTGLENDTQVNVKMFQPQTIQQCFLIGRLYEQAHPLKRDSEMKAEEEKEVAEIEVKIEVETKSSEKRAHEVILKEDLITQFQVHVSDSKILRNIELREEKLELENLEYVVKNEDLKQDGIQKNVRLVVDGNVERSLKVIRNTKIYSAHQLFGKLSQYKERLGLKKKRKGFKSRMFKYKSCFRKLHSLTFSKSMRMVETSSDLLLLNGKDSPARTAMGFKLEAGELASSNQERLELCPENNGYLESSNLELVLMKEEPESVKVNGVMLWTQSCNILDLIQAKMMGTKSLCNNESVYVLEDLSSAILAKNHSLMYCGFDCDAFLSGGVSRFWKFIGFDIITGRKVLTKRKKTFYKCRRFKFKHEVIPRAVQSGFEVKMKESSCTEYPCLFLSSKVTTLAHIFLGCGDMTLNLKKKGRFSWVWRYHLVVYIGTITGDELSWYVIEVAMSDNYLLARLFITRRAANYRPKMQMSHALFPNCCAFQNKNLVFTQLSTCVVIVEMTDKMQGTFPGRAGSKKEIRESERWHSKVNTKLRPLVYLDDMFKFFVGMGVSSRGLGVETEHPIYQEHILDHVMKSGVVSLLSTLLVFLYGSAPRPPEDNHSKFLFEYALEVQSGVGRALIGVTMKQSKLAKTWSFKYKKQRKF
ncbi:Retrotransposon gag domain [Arabidopsis thaliana x Arabidopsis arenosa]|uniref:Retrotransposon gag domain n=1 Tax=Arabidopsis thaliana x Arabidopsis arenosa TaxID=1240361 RepID=A0A8T1ZGF3_9BRAS|nr:Retrotransposon gag domain [Arabidopsis thaliana x Arabidopsis arenosa]